MTNILRVLWLHVCCQLLYIFASFGVFAQQRPIALPLIMLGSALCVEFLLGLFFLRDRGFWISVASVGITNSVFLNLEAYGLFYWPFFLALGASLASKYLLRVEGRPVFNPSIFGVFLISMLLPRYGTAGTSSWSNLWYFTLIVFLLGTAVVFFAGTIRLCYSYIITFFLAGSVIPAVLSMVHMPIRIFIEAQLTPPLFWSFAFFNVGTMIFAFHVIGDPMTSPKSHRGQILFGCLLGILDLFARSLPVLNGTFGAYLFLQLGVAGWRVYSLPKSLKQNWLLRLGG